MCHSVSTRLRHSVLPVSFADHNLGSQAASPNHLGSSLHLVYGTHASISKDKYVKPEALEASNRAYTSQLAGIRLERSSRD